MPRPLRAVNWQSRKFLLAELNRLCRQERTPNEQMIERFLQCEEAQTASRIVASPPSQSGIRSPGRIMTQDQLKALNLVAEPEPIVILPSAPGRVSQRSEAAIRARKWPNYDRCLQSAPPNHGNTGPDTSRADFTWCMTALDWGFDIAETTAKLMEVSDKPRENGARYATLTTQNAAVTVESKGQKAGRG